MTTSTSTRLRTDTIWELVEARAESTPDAEFAVDEHRRSFTFAEFRDLAEGIAAALYERGVCAGDVVSWQLPTTVESMALAVALTRLGAVQNPLVTMLRDKEVKFITDQLETSLLIVRSEFRGFDHAGMAARLAAARPGMEVLVVDASMPVGAPAILPPRASMSSETRFGPDISWILYTSGTTSAPKGVKHTDRTLLAAAATFTDNVQTTPQDRCAALIPVGHVGGLGHLLHALEMGHTLLVGATFVPEETTDFLIEQGVTLVGSGLPFTNEYLRISRERGVAPLFPKARAVLMGGSGRPRTLHEDAKSRLGGVGIISGYGMTECPYATWGRPDNTDLQHAEFEGVPGSGGEIRVVGAEGHELPAGEVGEIRLRAAQMFKGYVDSSLDADAFDDEGFFRTGDLGFLDADGCVSVTGRIKDIIVRKMENVSAREVEEILIGDPTIADVTVIGLPDPVSGERVCAVVVPADPDAPPTLESIREYLRTTELNVRKFPEQVEILDTIPRNPLGKIAKHELRKQFVDPDGQVAPDNSDAPGTTSAAEVVEFETIEFEVADHIATITLNRPERLNCFNETMAHDMAAAWARVRDDDDIHVAVLRANGERAFCTGVDLSEGAWWAHLNRWNQEDPGIDLGPKQHRVWKPVVCAVNGMAAGGAMYFINESDIVICSEDATFFDPHANGGIVSALEPIGMLARGIPVGEVLRWALLGSDERMTAETALRAGIVTEVTPTAALRERAHQLATEIAGRRPESIQGTVRAIWEALDMNPTTALRNGLSYTQIGNQGDGRSDSRKNKRTPRFR